MTRNAFLLKKNAALRPACLFLALCLALSLLPGSVFAADSAAGTEASSIAEDPVQAAVDRLTGWDIVRGWDDGQIHSGEPLTRAEFVALINRAYGYTQTGPHPFSDVAQNAWYADDIAIAYTAGYFNGSSPTTADPEGVLTREQAMVLLCRNMRMDEVSGEVIAFSDGRDFSSWSKGYVNAAVEHGLIEGTPDGEYLPSADISRGDMFLLLDRAIGSLVKESGQQSLGDVFGSVTITAPGTELTDTTIAGDLFISGGVGLGGVTLTNVNVLGKIIVAGGGESENGAASISLVNVQADALQTNSLTGQYISVSAAGDTYIQNADLRTSAFLLDRTASGLGFAAVTLNGAAGTAYTLSGNLNSVVDQTAGSRLTISDGAVDELTVDETAAGSTVNVDLNSKVKTLNLDAAASVTGMGSVESLTVNAAGSTVAALPDEVEIRPGVTASIYGQDMDAALAKESSADPRLLAGYPLIKNVAPTTADAVFSANKAGTVYWAVSTVADGSVEENELIDPPSYGGKAVYSGSLRVGTSNTEMPVRVTGLTSGGSYYLSAVLVDERGTRSPLKVVSFSTPDSSVPAFSADYPYMSKVTGNSAQVAVMTTKSCDLYYALLPKGSAAPTASEFKSYAVDGNLGFGVVSMTKNVPDFFYVNDQALEELCSYDLYLWLTDADGAQSSAVKKISFTTVDKTSPRFVTDLYVTNTAATTLRLSGSVNEAGTVYWAAVKKGTEYPKAPSGQTIDYQDESAFLEFLAGDYAKLQVANGGGSPIKSGSVSAKANTDFTINVTGLTGETSYDIYYVAKDSAGNYSSSVGVLTASTLDNVPPTASQRFDSFANDDDTAPFADTNVDIIFSETVLVNSTGAELLSLYNKVATAEKSNVTADVWAAKQALADALSATIKLYNVTGTNRAGEVPARGHDSGSGSVDENASDWVIDYYNAQVLMDDTDADGRRMIVRFENHGDDANTAAIKLKSGSSYYFEIKGIADTSSSRNLMGATQLPTFTTISAQAFLDDLNLTTDIQYSYYDGNGELQSGGSLPVSEIDMAFTMTPQSVSTVEDNINWEMLLWSDTSVTFDLYYKKPGDTVWSKAPKEGLITVPINYDYVGTNLQRGEETDSRHGLLNQSENDQLNSLKDEEEYQYAIHFNTLGGSSDRSAWSQDVRFRIQIITGSNTDLRNQTLSLTGYGLESTVDDISTPKDYTILARFTDSTPPTFVKTYPKFDISDMTGSMSVQVSRASTIYYVIAPVDAQNVPLIETKNEGGDVLYTNDDIPHMSDAGVLTSNDTFEVISPSVDEIINPVYDTSSGIIIGTPRSVGTGTVEIPLSGLKSDTKYFVYIVLQGQGGGAMSEKVMLYKFETQEIVRPVIELDAVNNPSVNVTSDIAANANYLLVAWDTSKLPTLLTQDFSKALESGAESGKYKTYWSDAYKASGFSVLDALSTDVRAGNKSIGSVFDLFASQDVKNQVANYIRAERSQSTDIAGGGSASLSAKTSYAVDCSRDPFRMLEDIQYCFLVVGRSATNNLEDDSSGDAFRAIYPIFLTDDTPIVITNVLSSLYVSTDTSNNLFLNGDVTVIFDGYLYYRDTSGSTPATRPVSLTSIDSTNLGTVAFYPVMSLLPNLNTNISVVGTENGGSPGQRITSITFQAKNVPIPSYSTSIVFKDKNLCDENGNPNTSTLTITIAAALDAVTGGYTVTVTIPKSWDGGGGTVY